MPFKLDGTISRILGNIGLFITVNLLCILCCLPLVTAGASITALHYVMLQFIHGDAPNLLSDFWKSFRANLRQGIAIHLIAAGVGALLYFNLSFAAGNLHLGVPFQIMAFLSGALAFLYLLTVTVIYPLLARYENTVSRTFYLAFLLAVTSFPTALLLLAVNLIPAVLFVLWPNAFLLLIPFYVFVGLSLVSYVDCLLLDRVFGKFA
ncbi:MAG: DUF624 domain-containing protein [Eubacteriales bacterium]|nr:DUF624 domain-containing protein [Eubacteriales bacterium]